MTGEREYREALALLRESYLQAAEYQRSFEWTWFENLLLRVFEMVSVISAAKVRWRVTHSQDRSWVAGHSEAMAPLIRARAAAAAQVERDYYTDRDDVSDQLIEFRLEMLYRNGIGDISQHAQQLALVDPLIGEKIPFFEYGTKDDMRVRPTHAMMHGFVAVKNWKGWKVCRPKNGYNCRCVLQVVTYNEARDRGWLTKGGKPRFQTLWPSTTARRHYENGLFPDPGWNGPKYVVGA